MGKPLKRSNKNSKSRTERSVTISRKSKETDVNVSLKIDGKGIHKINTGIGFLDHMLSLFARHGYFDLIINAIGDYHVDMHHTNEDVGIVLGQAFNKSLGTKSGIKRFGFFYVPMGEALTRVVIDISGRPLLILNSKILVEKVNGYSLDDATHFLESFAQHSGINMNITILEGRYPHHILESIFKCLGKALDHATQVEIRESGIPTTKGFL